ncbi:TPR and ankyrin repeat-containing protein 1 isoform X2 [Magallana gigas]|uniref:TPR and ankyrin repeat-containing protein 1 isoform X2 n=1 Tax=Magallana gigas TaxID=29159 RepID=UPI003341B67E
MDQFIFPDAGLNMGPAAFARLQLGFIAGNANNALQQGNLSMALQHYSAALNTCNMHYPFLQEDVPFILNSRSIVHSRMGNYCPALLDAQQIIDHNPFWHEGYIQAGVALKGLRRFKDALENFLHSYFVIANQPQHAQRGDQFTPTVDLLVEIITTIIQLPRHREDCETLLAEHQELHAGSEQDQRILLQQLAFTKCWEGVSLLVTGNHCGPRSPLDFSIPNCPANDMWVGCLLMDLSVNDLSRYGMQLAVALLKNGADFDEIERTWRTPVIHVVITKTLETGYDELLTLTFNKYLDSQDKKDAVDKDNQSVFHIIVQFSSSDDERKNALICRCIQNSCSPFILDQNEKLAIDYCKPGDVCYQTLSKIITDTESIRMRVSYLKARGNAAKGEMKNDQALKFYKDGLKLSKRSDILKRETAVLYTNISTVYSDLNNLQKALENATCATEMDSTWSKGHWRRSKSLRRLDRFSEAFEASWIGFNIPELSDQEKKSILIEGIKSFKHLSEAEKKEKYDVLRRIPNDIWSHLLENLSKQGEWRLIKELVLGLDNNTETEEQGAAKDADFSTVTFSTLFTFLIKEKDPKATGAWLVPLIMHITSLSDKKDEEAVLRFKECETDTALHAAARLSVITENLQMLQRMTELQTCINLKDGVGNSPLHSIVKMPRPPETGAFVQVVETLLRIGGLSDIKDTAGKLAVEFIDPDTEPKIFKLLKSSTGSVSNTEPPTELKHDTTTKESPPNNGFSENNVVLKTDNPPLESTEAPRDIFKFNKREGDKVFKKKEFKEALKFYKNAKEHMAEAKKSDLIDMFCNLADCFQFLEQYHNILEERNQFASYIETSVEAQFKIGKAYFALEKYEQGYHQMYRTYNLWPKSPLKDDILCTLAKCYSKCIEKGIRIPVLRGVIRMRKGEWMRLVYKLIQDSDGYSAGNIYFGLKGWGEKFHDSFDLKAVCNINLIHQHSWVIGFIMDLLTNGSDFRKLCIEKGESYLHAGVRIAFATKCEDLLCYLLDKAAKSRELDIQDSQSNTILHLAVDNRVLGTRNQEFQMLVVDTLLQKGVNPLILNKKRKLASRCVSNSFQRLSEHIKTFEKAMTLKIKTQEEEKRLIEKDRIKQKEEEKRRHQEGKVRNKKIRDEKAYASNNEKECRSLCADTLESAKAKIRSQNYRLAFYDLTHIFNNKKHKLDLHQQIENEALYLVISALGQNENPDIPEKLTKIPIKTYKKIVSGLAEKEYWKQMHIAVVEYRRHHECSSLSDFADGLSVNQVIKCKQFQQSEDLLIEIIENMLSSGAVLSEEGKDAIENAVQNNHFKFLNRLFGFGANPKYLSVETGDTPIHAALYIALERDQGNTGILEKFIEMFKEDPERFPLLDPASLNDFGDSLFHVIAKIKFSKTSLEVTRILCEKGVKSNIKDSEGRLPVEYLLNENDRRLQYFRLASRAANLHTDDTGGGIDSENKHNKKKTRTADSSIPDAPLKKQKLKENISLMISELKDIGMYSEELMTKSRKRRDVKKKEACDLELKHAQKTNAQTSHSAPAIPIKDVGSFQETLSPIEPGMFEDNEWEIECTSLVWEKLISSALPLQRRKEIIASFQRFASGIFSTSICLEIEPGSLFETIEIYETGPILWEIAVSFSPRLTDSETDSINVYTETVRVWDIVETNTEKEASLARIKESYLRGGECIYEKYLTCSVNVDQKLFDNFDEKKRIPRRYFGCSRSDTEIEKQKMIFPGSYSATEFHILKFYSFTTQMAMTSLQSNSCTKDFPFKVTEVEHSVICLPSSDPILLLGRSGTGKTTCCLYRLWSRYDQNARDTAHRFDAGDEDDESGSMDNESNNELTQDDVEKKTFRQLFITKNLVLCNEVQKTFSEMRNSLDDNNLPAVSAAEETIPPRLQDLQNSHFPLFLTSRKLLLMLDGSLPDPFFRRDASGNIVDDIPGWSSDDDSLSFLPKLEDDSESESDEELYDEQSVDNDNPGVSNRKKCAKIEVTYDVFCNSVWPKIRKGFEQYHPSLVWMEIISFIKGSYEALVHENGYLDRREYILQGKKKAPNFSGERETIYDIFLKYRHFLKQRFWFDEADVVRNIFCRLQGSGNRINNLNINEIYVDETQDFTQAELYLLLHICQNPNDMFLTGDTAQGIMRGISFRFKDLRSLFYHASQTTKSIKVPERIHQLSHNYRSHIGVLNLASSILDILVEYFPESFDILQKDLGLFNGPSPILLEICDKSNLAVLLKGKGKSTSRIEFGAHQAVLVANDRARDNLPDELQHGIVLTIYEAKGLEFDDVLLYNFFQASQAGKEWRVVTQFLEKLCTADRNEMPVGPLADCESLTEIDYSVFEESNRPRPLAFDQNKHKVLNTELKQLYTAITRARVHVWIFDENEDNRAPMFEYFKARKLVQSVKEGETGFNLGFAEVSSPEEWIETGEKFMKKSLFNTAATCFREAGEFEMEKIAKCHQKALDASKMIEYPAQMQELFLSAAHDFLECEHPLEAGKCLENAKELSLAADLYRKTNMVEKAAEIYIKMRLPLKGSKCYEEAGQFKQALSLLIKHNLFEAAIDCLHRYQILVQEYKHKKEPIPSRLVANAPGPNHSEQKLSLQAAESFLKQGKIEKMMLALNRLPDVKHKVEFLTVNDRIQEAINVLQSEGTPRQLVDVYLNDGMTDKALSYAANLGDSDLRNKCHIFDIIIRLDGNNMDVTSKREISKKLEQVFYAMQDSKEKALAGKAILIAGKLIKEVQYIGQAYGAFDHCEPFPNIAGQLDCMDWMTMNADLRNPKNLSKCILGMDTLFKALNILMRPINESERTQQLDILEYYGFYRSTKEGIFRLYPRQKPIAASFIPKHILNGHVCDVKLLDACKSSFKFLAENGLKWKSKLENELKNTPDECLKSSLDALRKRVQIFVRRIELEMHIRVGSMEFERRGSIFDKELGLLKEISFSNCEHLLRDIFQDDGTISFSTLDWEPMLQFCNYLKNPGKRFFHQNLTYYLQFLIQHHCPSWKKDDVPNFLCFLFVYDVFGERLQITPAFVLKDKDENTQTEETKSTIQKDVTKSQFDLIFDDEKEEMLPVSSICARISECQELLKGLKPHAALIEFGIFCETLSKCDVMLLPCVSPLLYWMEFYLTLFLFSSTALLTTPNESNPNKIFLPLSYYRNTIAMGCAFTNRTDIIRNIIKSSKDSKQHKQTLLKSLQSMGQLLFGTSSKLNLFDFIFSSEENKLVRAQKNAFSERLLVLCLAVFCNLRKKVDKAAEIEKELAEKIWSLVS